SGWVFAVCAAAHAAPEIANAGAGAVTNAYATLYETDWQSGIDPRASREARSGGIELVADPADASRNVLRAHIDPNQPCAAVANGVPRAEVVVPEPVRFEQGRDYLIRWSTWLPADFEFDSRQLMIITQVHQRTRTGAPTLALTLLGERYAISVRGGVQHDK